MVNKRDLEIIRGDTASYLLTFSRASVPTDITGWTIMMTVKESYTTTSNDTDAIMQATVTSHTDAVNGLTTVTFTAGQTKVVPKNYFHDIQYVTTSGTVNTVMYGLYKVLPEYTTRTS